jgi:hypothetical protein
MPAQEQLTGQIENRPAVNRAAMFVLTRRLGHVLINARYQLWRYLCANMSAISFVTGFTIKI